MQSGRNIAGTFDSLYGHAMTKFAVCRQPWKEYTSLLAKQDTEPYHTELNQKPMYRGRKKGVEGWLFQEGAQLHYHKYPDSAIFCNLARWRQGDTIGDTALQQFQHTQPFLLDRDDPHGFNTPDSETYMKLNYKNPQVFSRYLTRTGHEYQRDVRPLNPEAVKMLRVAKATAIRLGLYPRSGNPFWHRTQQFKPKPFQDQYDPVTATTKQTMEQFSYNWLQTKRIKDYFAAIEEARARRSVSAAGTSTAEQKMQSGYVRKTVGSYVEGRFNPAAVPFSDKRPTVPGLMSLQGLRKRHYGLYSNSTKKRMGFTNPLNGIRRI